MRFLLATLLRLFETLADYLLWAIIVALLVRMAGVLEPGAGFNDWALVISLRKFLDPLLASAGAAVGVKWPATSGWERYFPLAPAALAYGVKVTLRRALDLWRWQMLEASSVNKVRRGTEVIDAALASDSWKSRELLLKQYRDIEKKLQSVRRTRCTFLNVDVVGSTKMKDGETPTAIAASFQAYEELLRRIFKKNKVWKQSWTPDGVLVCFREREQAVHAAQQLLGALPQFNSNENRLKLPFRVRCGVSEGDLAIFDDTNLSTFSDPVIDTAAHMQKEARPNSVCLAEELVASLPDRAEFRATGAVVDGYPVYEWSLEPLPPGAEPSLLTPRMPTPVTPVSVAPVVSAASIPQSQPMVAAAPRSIPAAPPSSAPAAPAAANPSPERTIALHPEAAQARRTIGRYEIVKELGRGAMGAVYEAVDPQIGRTVALKVILTRGRMDEEMRIQKERFLREARAAGKLLHPGIVTIYDVGEDSFGSPYLVMEFVEGTTLDKALARGGPAHHFTIAQRLALAIEIGSALDYAHRHGVIHRDIKPANILLTRDGHAKIADFGIAKLADTQATIGGPVLGTPAFVSPEQLTGSPADARSDIFSFGVVLYWMFTGERPFHGETLTAVSYKVVHTAPPPARQLNWALPEELDVILSRCLAKNPADRFQSAAEVVAALEALREGRARSA